ncbi:carboxypeptidase-like regulatory domain-containing protein, partial [Pedobacter ginsenosidimutans]|uniref:carboxypeptidase-like regulatory domain-containing protein n=1 Tax=Pedobacter ginsenosidimutans TaxID=687842 RepID=UPI000A5AB9BD
MYPTYKGHSIFRVLCLLLLFCTFSLVTFAQIKVSGKVIDAQNQAIQKANIKFKNGKDQLNTSSDSLGNFSVVLPKTANYTITISAIGYSTFNRIYSVNGIGDIKLDAIVLQSTNEELQTVEVVGTNGKKYYGNYSFSATKTATLNKDIPQAISSVSKELIADRQAAVLADAVKNVTSVSQSSYYNQFSIRGINQNEEGAIINGMRTRQYYFNQPLTNNLERIEVIKGPASATFSSVD